MEELYVSNDKKTTIPFEVMVDRRSYLKIEKMMEWDTPIHEKFAERQLSLTNDCVTPEQAFSFMPHPDTLPLTKHDQEMAIAGVLAFLRKEFPNNTANWMLNSLHRDKRYIIAELKQIENIRVPQRKLKVFIDSTHYEAVNYFDNQLFLEMFERYASSDVVTTSKEAAFEKIQSKLELTPVYVYDFEQKRYRLCGKLDCQYGVLATSGDVIELDEV